MLVCFRCFPLHITKIDHVILHLFSCIRVEISILKWGISRPARISQPPPKKKGGGRTPPFCTDPFCSGKKLVFGVG